MKLIDKLNEVIPIAMQKEPAAWLYEVQAIMKETDGKVLPDNLYLIRVIFGLPNNRTLIYEIDKDEKVFTRILEEPWLEDVPIPNKITTDLSTAFERMELTKLPYEHVNRNAVLRFPLYPGINEPAYVFEVDSHGERKFIAVNLYSAKVEFVE